MKKIGHDISSRAAAGPVGGPVSTRRGRRRSFLRPVVLQPGASGSRSGRRAPAGRAFSGLAGVGDLIATCMSPLSRNCTCGEHLGRGMTVEGGDDGHLTDRRGREVVRSILALARHHGVEMPVTEVVALINGTPAVEAARRLMNRSPKAERYDT